MEAITPAKAARLYRLGCALGARARTGRLSRVRVDVVTVVLARAVPPVVTHYVGVA